MIKSEIYLMQSYVKELINIRQYSLRNSFMYYRVC